MLTKHNEIDIPVNNPFVNDKLERKKIAENLTRLVQSTNQPFVISIEAPWGWGKTTFIKMWKAQLESIGHTCLYFNAWENDFVEDPLIAFIGEISKAIGDKKPKGKIGTQLGKLRKIAGKIVRRALPLTIQIATHGVLSQEAVKKTSELLFTSSDEIADFASEIAEEQIKHYKSDKNGIDEFKRELAKFAKSLSEAEGGKAPLVFFIDELDRCRPDFSISLLERVKHVFSAEGMVFILSIDRMQIEQSIKSIYGQGMEAEGYLRRFIDFSLPLPMPSTESFFKFLYDYFHFDEVFGTKQLPYRDSFFRTFVAFANTYHFSPRVIEQCFTEMNLVLRTAPIKPENFSEFLAFLVALKAHDIETYKSLGTNLTRENIGAIMDKLKREIDKNESIFEWLLPAIEAFLFLGYLSHDEKEKLFAQFRQVMEKGEDSEKHDAEIMVSYYEKSLHHRGYPSLIRDLISWLDIVGDLSFQKLSDS